MQRQSLGSPSTKHLLLHESSSSSSSPLSTNTTSLIYEPEEKEQVKKLLKLKPKLLLTNSHETYIHLIPILTLLCFLILYLSSHNPSQNGTHLAQFNGFNRLHNPRDLGENISELQGIVEIKKGEILAVRSLKNLVRQDEINQRRLHRRFLGRK